MSNAATRPADLPDRTPAGAFRSPWRHPPFVRAVALVRRSLSRWPRLEERFVERLVTAQNRRVERHLAVHRPESVLLILPRCVKPRTCTCDVRVSLGACSACTECEIGPLARLCSDLGVRALIAFRSHQAFAIAREERPDLILASACHDRLIKALRSVPEVPALLQPLASLERRCVNATFDRSWFTDQLRRLAPATGPRTGGTGRTGPQ
ncbi:MAG: DUF116 domain-containing protein [Candidatus Krumholzibacteriia bacterium]